MEFLWYLSRLRTPFFDMFFRFITRFGEEMILIAIFCAIYWCINKRMAYVTGITFFLSSLAVQGLKIVFRVPRPWIYDLTFEPVGGSLYASTGYAFPSGHTQNAAALLGSIGAQTKKKWLSWLLFIFVFLVAFSRLYLGVHFIQDVVVSLLITFVIIWIAQKLVGDEHESPKQIMIAFGTLLIAGIIVALYAWFLRHNNISTAAQVRDATRASGAAIGFAFGMYIERSYIKFSVKSKNLLIQVTKYVLGMIGLVAIQEGSRILGTHLFMDAIRYFLIVMWIAVLYPLIIKKFFEYKTRSMW